MYVRMCLCPNHKIIVPQACHLNLINMSMTYPQILNKIGPKVEP